MSRIQDILAKAERDGTAGRTHNTTSAATATAVQPALSTLTLAPPVAGTSALEASPFATAANAAAATAPAVVETRTARPTLHPALVAAIAPHAPAAEQYRAIRTRLSAHEELGPLRTIAVTSPGSGDGKSVTACNLALTMAQEFQRNVLLIDAHLRTPTVHAMFGLEAAPGFAEVLSGEITLDEALVYLPELRLTVLPAGGTPAFPTELLGSTAMRRTLDTLRGRFDRIVLDLPAAAPLADVGTVAPLADGVVMVVRAGITQRPALDQALETFEEHKVLGIVLNDAR